MFFCKLILLALIGGIGFIAYEITKVPPLPNIPDTYWGKGRSKPDDVTVYPFTVNVTNEILDDLKARIRSTNSLPPPLEGVGFQYGFNSDYLKVILDYWANNYNWRKFESALNKFPQYKTQIAGLNIHFIRALPTKVPEGYKVYPLLLLHGWPGSIKEFQKIIPLLTSPSKDKDFIFEVIAPSLPGYGWSDAAVRPGLGAAQMALIFKKLMHRLGHDEFIVQGGDWGGLIGTDMATLYPENVKGFHSNMCSASTPITHLKYLIGSLYPPLVVEEKYADRMYPMGKFIIKMILESGYFHIQATKPDTVGIGLLDSPAGLVSYIGEKFSTGTNPNYRNLPDGGITRNLILDDILDDVTIYWVTNSMTTAMRLYTVGLLDSPAGLAAYILEKFITWTDKTYEFKKENGQLDKIKLEEALDDVTIYWVTKTIGTSVRMYSETINNTQTALGLTRIPTHVPTSCIMFPYEILYQPKFILKEKYANIIQMNHPPRGGHFAALEEPEILSQDVFEFVEKLRIIEKEEQERTIERYEL